MTMARNEHTIAADCQCSGRGYWTGKTVRVHCWPADAGTGIRFRRVDLESHPECQAEIRSTDSVPFRTNLRVGDSSVGMVEHLLAALRGLEIDNCVVDIDGDELPALDGSSLGWSEMLQSAGLIIQPAIRSMLRIDSPIRIDSECGWIAALPTDGHAGQYEYQLDYGAGANIRPQNFSIVLTPGNFIRQLASARTFVTLEQADQLRRSGVASHVTTQDLLVIGPSGPVDNDYRFRDECARHKTLDMVGDLSLVGVDLVGRFVSYRGGHQLNGLLAQRLSELLTQEGRLESDIQTDPFAARTSNAIDRRSA
ncbi:MAG: UDP-3-O-acyl-N-acetylglucosamine deacetylase [Planctomycetota bacterium]